MQQTNNYFQTAMVYKQLQQKSDNNMAEKPRDHLQISIYTRLTGWLVIKFDANLSCNDTNKNKKTHTHTKKTKKKFLVLRYADVLAVMETCQKSTTCSWLTLILY